MYKGIIKDQLGTMDTRYTKKYETYQEAHNAAEKLCKATMGDRGTISVIEAAHGGSRPGAGRPATDRKQRNIMASDEEWVLIKKYADEVRKK